MDGRDKSPAKAARKRCLRGVGPRSRTSGSLLQNTGLRASSGTCRPAKARERAKDHPVVLKDTQEARQMVLKGRGEEGRQIAAAEGARGRELECTYQRKAVLGHQPVGPLPWGV